MSSFFVTTDPPFITQYVPDLTCCKSVIDVQLMHFIRDCSDHFIELSCNGYVTFCLFRRYFSHTNT